MQTFLENSFKEFVKSRDDIFGTGSEFVGFEYDRKSAEDSDKGLQSDTLYGCICYRNNDANILMSPPLVVKFPSAENDVVGTLLLLFTNEIFLYSHILPFFAHLQTSVAELFPTFYGSFTRTYCGSTEAVIMLENLRHSTYRHAPCKAFLDYAHLSVMVRTLGRFHAFSYLAKELDPVRFHDHILFLNPVLRMLTGKHSAPLMLYGARGLQLVPHTSYESSIPVIRHFLRNATQILQNLYKNERDNPWAVVCHGDYLSLNVMFKYEKGLPVDAKMIDLATSTFSSPVLDLALLLYMNASQQTRDLHWDQLIDDYYDGLSSLPVPVAKLPSKDIIIRELELKAFYAYIPASVFLPMLLSHDHNMGSHHQFLPPKYSHCKNLWELPENIRIDALLKVGGEIGTNAVGDILKDMLNRGFVRNFSLSNDRVDSSGVNKLQ